MLLARRPLSLPYAKLLQGARLALALLLLNGAAEGNNGEAAPTDNKPSAAFASPEAAAAASTVIKDADLPEHIRSALQKTLNKSPGSNQWAGQVDSVLFGISVRSLPAGDIRARATPLLLSAVQMLAVEELLLNKAIVDRYIDSGLTDVRSLKEALARAAQELHVIGHIKGLLYQSRPQGDFAVAFVIADSSDLSANYSRVRN